jgi:hypothetical protein
MASQNGEGYSHLVAQASGMVSVQADCMLSKAIVMMKARASLDGVTLEELAVAIVTREIRFGL